MPRVSWRAVLGFGLLVALSVAVLVQVRQFALLRQAVQASSEYAVLAIYQAEGEFLRLREIWSRMADKSQTPDLAALALRYEIWISRIDLLRSQRPRRLIEADARHRQTMQEIEAFIVTADRALGPTPSQTPNREFLASTLPALQALAAPHHELALSVSHQVARQLAERADAVRRQNQIGTGLTVSLALLVLGFAATALRHVRKLRERRVALELLTSKLRQARRDAEAASEAKSVFLANMSHEIRTPFHGLMGMLSLLRETGLSPRQIDFLHTATESADHLLAVLNDILDMSQLETGRLALNPAPLDLRTLLRDVEALMRPQASVKSLALHIDTDPGVPERILADATRVKQVIFNLLSNAIKFSEHGAVALEVRVRAAAEGDSALEFIITDTGMGMSAATTATLFNRFVQGDGSSVRRHGGTGLGLEISRNLARLMGGDIAVRSQLGKGSVFTFSMPLATPLALPILQPLATPAGKFSTGPLRVLVAEDHPVNRQYMAALLDNLGHQAHFSNNGQEAVQAAREQHFDVVLMDLHMPVLDGIGATRAIRALSDPASATVPIVALTADAFEQTRERCLVAGMNDFLTKPVSPQKLSSMLRRLFGNSAGGSARAAAPLGLSGSGEVGHPLIDETALHLAMQAMSRERLATMIEEFIGQAPQTVKRLRAAVRDAQPLELRVNAHAAKGAALNLGLSALAATASSLHEGAAHLPAHEIARLVQRYEDLLPLTRAAVAAAGFKAAGAPVTG